MADFTIEDGPESKLVLVIPVGKLRNAIATFATTYGWLAQLVDARFTHQLTLRPGYDRQEVKREIESFVKSQL